MTSVPVQSVAFALLWICSVWGTSLSANGFNLPENAELFEQVISDSGQYAVPLGVWTADDGLYAKPVTGRIVRESWHIPDAVSTNQIMSPILENLGDDFKILVDCTSRNCGGFDFRFEIDVLPAPSIYINLMSYRFVTAQSRADPNEFVTLLASVHKGTGYVQIVRAYHVNQSASPAITDIGATSTAPPSSNGLLSAPTGSVLDQLTRSGRAVLGDLAFASGSSSLQNGEIPSLSAVATFMKNNPNTQIAIVGHTDATGPLAINQAISRKRAESVMRYLIQKKNIRSNRLQADGVGYLAPIATNTTETGRSTNRRVEAVVVSVD